MPRPDSLLVPDEEFNRKCALEGPYDARHLGRYLIYEYACSTCGTVYVPYEPDYGYCGPNSNATCPHCYRMIPLVSPKPVIGTPRPVVWENMLIRTSS